MANGDPYINCDNSDLTWEQLFRRLLEEDADGNPVLRTNGSGGGSSANFEEEDLIVSSQQVVSSQSPSFIFGLFYSGIRLKEGIGYTRSGDTFTLTGIPSIDDGETLTLIYAY